MSTFSAPAIVGYAAAVASMWLIYMDRRTYRDAWRCRRWKQARAIVTAIRDESFEIESFSEYGGSAVERIRERCYTFRYRVGKTTYRSERYSFSGGQWPQMPSFKRRSVITIYYDPAQPQSSVVRRDIPPRLLWMPCAALAALGWACWSSWF